MKAQLATPLEHVHVKQYVQSDQWWVEQKLDGQRFLLLVAEGEISAFNRNGVEMTLPDQIAADFVSFKTADTMWHFDGELVDGEYHIFDVLWAGDTCDGGMTDKPFEQRRNRLEKIFSFWEPDHCHLVRCAKTETEKADLIVKLERECSEGAVLKKRTATYNVHGKRVKTWLKLKFVQCADVVVMELNRGGKPQAVTIGMMRERVTFSNNGHRRLATTVELLEEVAGCKVPANLELEVGDVLEVRYLYATEDNKLTQPIFVRKRTDKQPEECTMSDQMKFTSKAIW